LETYFHKKNNGTPYNSRKSSGGQKLEGRQDKQAEKRELGVIHRYVSNGGHTFMHMVNIIVDIHLLKPKKMYSKSEH
jgi:hypothetical protein